MVLWLFVGVALAGAVQDPAKQLDKEVETLLDTKVGVDMRDALLEHFIAFIEPLFDLKVPFYIDPVEVKKPDEILINATAAGALRDILKESLKTKDLVYRVWNGAIVVTTEKGMKDFEKPEWSGLSLKEIEGRKDKDLGGKLGAVHEFDWSPFDPKKALEVLSKASGLAIDTAGIDSMKPAEENKHLLYPRKTTLYGALVCLSRTTGITFEATKDGRLVARLPKPK